MPGPMQRLEPLRLRHQQRRRLVRPDDARRMRVEGHRHRRAAMLGGAALHALDDLEMPAVQAVEVAERQHRMHQPRRPRRRPGSGWSPFTPRRRARRARAHHMPVQHPQADARWSRRAQDRASCASCTRAAACMPGDDVERLAHGEVRRVRLVAQRVDDQRVHAFDERPGRVVDAVAVGEVREVAEAETRAPASARATAAPARRARR